VAPVHAQALDAPFVALENAIQALTAQVAPLATSQAAAHACPAIAPRASNENVPDRSRSPVQEIRSPGGVSITLATDARKCRDPCAHPPATPTLGRRHPIFNRLRCGISVLPRPPNCRPDIGQNTSTDIRLVDANGSQINTYGPKQLHLDLGFKRLLSWTFEMADVSRPIIGADFLHYSGLLIGIRHNRLLVNSSVKVTPATVSPRAVSPDRRSGPT